MRTFMAMLLLLQPLTMMVGNIPIVAGQQPTARKQFFWGKFYNVLIILLHNVLMMLVVCVMLLSTQTSCLDSKTRLSS